MCRGSYGLSGYLLTLMSVVPSPCGQLGWLPSACPCGGYERLPSSLGLGLGFYYLHLLAFLRLPCFYVYLVVLSLPRPLHTTTTLSVSPLCATFSFCYTSILHYYPHLAFLLHPSLTAPFQFRPLHFLTTSSPGYTLSLSSIGVRFGAIPYLACYIFQVFALALIKLAVLRASASWLHIFTVAAGGGPKFSVGPSWLLVSGLCPGLAQFCFAAIYP